VKFFLLKKALLLGEPDFKEERFFHLKSDSPSKRAKKKKLNQKL